MISLRSLCMSYGALPAVIDASLEIASGASVALSGPSASGKTTLLRLIAGLEEPQSGEVWIGGKLASAPRKLLLAPHQRGLGMAFQSPALWPHLTVAQNILYGVRGGAPGQTSLVGHLLEALELTGLARRYPGEISGGQARRVALARALAPRPACLLLDEPLVNLQPDLRARLLEFTVAWARESGAALLYVTHDPLELERIPGRRLSMRAGRLDHAGEAA